MDNNRKFTIVEFSDGLQIVPTTWLSTTKETCIWPSHMKTQLRINRAIMTGEMPKEQYDWGELPVKRIFGGASTYEKSMEKLILAQDTSNVDDTGMSSGDTRERDKKRRRIRAKRKVSSSSDDEELVANKENHRTLNNILPPFPEIEKFVSNSAQQKEICTQHIENIMYEDIFTNAFIDKDVSLQIQNKKEPVTPVTPVKSVTPKNIHVDKEDSSNQEFRKQVLLKLNKILYKMDRFENILNVFDEKLQYKNNEISEECDIQLPLVSVQDLNNFEEQLQESQFKQNVLLHTEHTGACCTARNNPIVNELKALKEKRYLNALKLVGGSTMHIMTTNILKKVMVNTLAAKFSWAGMKGKLIFKDLSLVKIIMQAVRLNISYSQTTNAEIADFISKWLAQAPLRTKREMKRIQTEEK